jgi:4'-phosphopantetheinyl transferase
MKEKIRISPNEVHLWICMPAEIGDLSLLSAYPTVLDDGELSRMRRFHFEKDKHSFLVSHTMVRTVLSEYSSVEPPEWGFEHNDYGKPEIIEEQNPLRLRFNLSHTDGSTVCAVTQKTSVGADVETRLKPHRFTNIAYRYFSEQEIADLTKHPLSIQEKRFLDYWTLKEAYIKAQGNGLSMPLDSFSFLFSDQRTLSITFHADHQPGPKPWHFWLTDNGRHHVIAVCKQKASVQEQPKMVIRQIIPMHNYVTLGNEIRYESACSDVGD